MKKKGIVTGKVRVRDEWDPITIDYDNGIMYYLGKAISEFSNNTVTNVANDWVNEGKLVLEPLSPTKHIRRFNSGMTF